VLIKKEKVNSLVEKLNSIKDKNERNQTESRYVPTVKNSND
jgi:hypothetical protein